MVLISLPNPLKDVYIIYQADKKNIALIGISNIIKINERKSFTFITTNKKSQIVVHLMTTRAHSKRKQRPNLILHLRVGNPKREKKRFNEYDNGHYFLQRFIFYFDSEFGQFSVKREEIILIDSRNISKITVITGYP